MDQRRAARLRFGVSLNAVIALLLCASSCSLQDDAPAPLAPRSDEKPSDASLPEVGADAGRDGSIAPDASRCTPTRALTEACGTDENCDGEIATCDTVVTLDAQNYFACAVLANGTLDCLGARHSSMLAPAASAGDWVDVALGYGYACGLERSGRIACWGDLASTGLRKAIEAEADGSKEYVEIAAAQPGLCTRDGQGAIKCWGESALEKSAPSAMSGFERLVCGDFDCCAHGPEGARCWGNNFSDKLMATAPFGAAVVEQVAVGRDFACALESDEAIVCVDAAASSRFFVDPMPQPTRAIGAYGYGVCAALIEGGVTCWGQDAYDVVSSAPRQGSFVLLDGNEWTMCGVTEGGERVCWGLDPEALRRPPPGRYTSLTAGTAHFCALDEEGSTRCWGDNSRAQLDAPALPIRSIASGSKKNCALEQNGTDVFCWGQDAGAPIKPSRIRGLIAWDMEFDHLCAIRLEGSNDPEVILSCWGADGAGQSSPPPTLRSSDEKAFVDIAVGKEFSCLLRDSGAIVCWGSDEHWQQIDGVADRPSPREDRTDPWVSIEGAREGLCAQAASGVIKCWGDTFRANTDLMSADPGTLGADVDNACASQDGSPFCWGGDVLSRLEAPPSAREGFVFSILGGCALTQEKGIVCW